MDNNRVKKWIAYIVIAVCLGCFIGGWFLGRKSILPVITVQTDTTIYNLPAPVHVEFTGAYKFTQVPIVAYYIDTFPEPYFVHDTLIIPVEQKIYESDKYKAWISGFKPHLDSILIYNTTTVVTYPQIGKNPTSLAFFGEGGFVVLPERGIYAGLGVDFRLKQFSLTARGGVTALEKTHPYLVVGAKYNF